MSPGEVRDLVDDINQSQRYSGKRPEKQIQDLRTKVLDEIQKGHGNPRLMAFEVLKIEDSND